MIKRWLQRIAYPVFDCEDCIGVGCGREHPCYCAYNNASAPNMPPTRMQRIALWILSDKETAHVR